VDAFFQVLEDDDAFEGPLEYHHRPSPLEYRLTLKKTYHAMCEAKPILVHLRKRLTRGRGGPRYGSLRSYSSPRLHFVQINWCPFGSVKPPNIAQLHQKTVAPKEWQWSVVKIANLNVKKGTVETILAEYVKDRN
jgi:hypothetical protein